ncbi:fimbrial protein [Dyella sp.]|jgi:type 1 fimbria pilin|uniref:fimbrial protein n=1 Tax=Dyella sp. TaxID=1869338 RepID=UPI002D789A12|nr:fimbrial protein [Dyella sp.]HET6431364.1 fimbrial protein [Dyella sp.]
MALAALLLALAPAGVRAGCDFAAGETQGTYTVRVPTTIVNDPSIAVNSVLYTSAATGINHRVDFNCNGNNNRWGLINDAGPTPATGEITFPTGVAGIGYRVLQNGSYIRPYDYFDLSGSSAWYENDAVTLELVKTGAITDGSQLLGSRLASFKAGKPNNFIVDAVINLANTLTFTAPACQVNTTSIDVVLPTVTTGAFSGPDSVSGSTPFQIGLTCSSGATVRITLDTASPVPGKTGVIAPSAGGASGIGVQLVNATDSTPVTFGAPRVLGATPNGNLSVGYVARYLQTGSNVGAGNVSATATFTLSYQ